MGGGMSHDSATLDVLEDVDNSPNRPLDDGGDGEGHHSQGRAEDLTPAWVAARPTLHASKVTTSSGPCTHSRLLRSVPPSKQSHI